MPSSHERLQRGFAVLTPLPGALVVQLERLNDGPQLRFYVRVVRRTLEVSDHARTVTEAVNCASLCGGFPAVLFAIYHGLTAYPLKPWIEWEDADRHRLVRFRSG